MLISSPFILAALTVQKLWMESAGVKAASAMVSYTGQTVENAISAIVRPVTSVCRLWLVSCALLKYTAVTALMGLLF
jgi:hypothetical protein